MLRTFWILTGMWVTQAATYAETHFDSTSDHM